MSILASDRITTSNISLNITGIIMPFAMNISPTGWVECDGSQYASGGSYSNLFNTIGYLYTPLIEQSASPNYFRVPDYRGYFIRCRDNYADIDPDKSSRTNRIDGTSADSEGVIVGTTQDDQFIEHSHDGIHYYNSTEEYNLGLLAYGLIEATNINSINGLGDFRSGTTEWTTYRGSDTRPKNIYVMYCIKL